MRPAKLSSKEPSKVSDNDNNDDYNVRNLCQGTSSTAVPSTIIARSTRDEGRPAKPAGDCQVKFITRFELLNHQLSLQLAFSFSI